MEPTVTVETTNSFITTILSSGLFGVVALIVSTLMLIGGIIGLLANKGKPQFYIWILGTLIKFNLLSCALIFAVGITKFRMCLGSSVPFNIESSFISVIMELMGGVALILLVAFIAFIAKTIAEIKPKYKCQPLK